VQVGGVGALDALAMDEEATECVAPVAGMDHNVVLAAPQPELVDRPPRAAWPDGTIIVDSLAPLMHTLPASVGGASAGGSRVDGTARARARARAGMAVAVPRCPLDCALSPTAAAAHAARGHEEGARARSSSTERGQRPAHAALTSSDSA
jgi:hypothetical protein